MSTAREDILARLKDTARSPDGPAQGRLAVPGINPVPARGRGSAEELIARFVDMALFAGATVARVPLAADVPGEVAGTLARAGLGDELVMAADPLLAAMPWSARPRLVIRRGTPHADDRVSLTPAFAGIAETGTLMVHSGPTLPNGLHFLPETHIAVLEAAKIMGAYEDAWAALRTSVEETGVMPRAVTLITGPSRTADIERTPQIGVHGPKKLHIVVVDGEET
jgi:L-lactate dehydrogenase complex protein LldG